MHHEITNHIYHMNHKIVKELNTFFKSYLIFTSFHKSVKKNRGESVLRLKWA